MPSSTSEPKRVADVAAASALIQEHAVGKQVKTFEVFGVNSLKTLTSPSYVSDQSLKSVELDDGMIKLIFGECVIRVDLQRTGTAAWSGGTTEDDLRVTRRATGRLVFSDGGVLEFIEPAKTKRISFWIDVPK